MHKSENGQVEVVFDRSGILNAFDLVMSEYSKVEKLSTEDKLAISEAVLEGNISIEGKDLTEAELSCIFKKAKSIAYYEVAYGFDFTGAKDSLEKLLFSPSESKRCISTKISSDVNLWYAYIKSIEKKESSKQLEAIGSYLEMDLRYTSLHYDTSVWEHIKTIDTFFGLFRAEIENTYTLHDMYTKKKNEKIYLVDYGLKYIYENKDRIKEIAAQIKNTDTTKSGAEYSRKSTVFQSIAPEYIKIIRSIYQNKQKISEVRDALWCVSDVVENVWCFSNILMYKHRNSRKDGILNMETEARCWPRRLLSYVFGGFIKIKNVFLRIRKRGVHYIYKIEELEQQLEREKGYLERLKKAQEFMQNELSNLDKKIGLHTGTEDERASLISAKDSMKEITKEIRLKVATNKGWIEQVQEDIRAMEDCRNRSTDLISKIRHKLSNLTLEQKLYAISHIDSYTNAYGHYLNFHAALISQQMPIYINRRSFQYRYPATPFPVAPSPQNIGSNQIVYGFPYNSVYQQF